MAQITISGQAVIPNDWLGEYCCYSVMWPNSPQWLAILRGVLEIASFGRYWDAHTGTVTEAQAVIKATLNHNLHLEECIMSCADIASLASALNNIASALQSQADNTATHSGDCGCSGTGNAGQFPAHPSDTQQGTDPETDPPPDDFDSWDQFFTQKCGLAHHILESLKLDLGHLAILTISGLSVDAVIEAVIVFLTLEISSAGIAGIVGLIFFVASTIFITTALSIVNDNYNDLWCALYNGHNATESLNNFLSVFDAAVDDGVSDPVENFIIKQLIRYMMTYDETNLLYHKDTSIDWSGYDCSMCTPETICFTFDEDVQGFETIPDLESLGIQGTVEWVSPGALFIQSDTNGAGGFGFALSSPAMDHVIEAGDIIAFLYTDVPAGSFNNYFWITVDGTDHRLTAITSGMDLCNQISLEDYVGGHLTRFVIEATWTGGAFDATLDYAGVNCPACI